MFERFLGSDTFGPSFKPWGREHIIVLLVLGLLILLIYLNRKRLSNVGTDLVVRRTTAVLLFLVQMSYHCWHLANGTINIDNAFPMGMCSIIMLMTSLMLWTKSYAIFELLVFWSFAGSVQAFITPDFEDVGIYHFRFYQFFLSHGIIVVAPFYMIFVHRYVPRFKSMLKAYAAIQLVVLPVFLFNYLTGANYMYLMRKPPMETMLDYFGDWPFYLLGLELVTVLFFVVIYLLFLGVSVKRHSGR